MFRAYTLIVNGVELATLKRDAWVLVEVPAGPVEVMAKIDWCGSNTLQFDLAPDEEAQIVVENHYGAWRSGYAIGGGAADYLRLTREDGTD